jgi:hypothetical protein
VRKVDELCAERDRMVGKQRVKYPCTNKAIQEEPMMAYGIVVITASPSTAGARLSKLSIASSRHQQRRRPADIIQKFKEKPINREALGWQHLKRLSAYNQSAQTSSRRRFRKRLNHNRIRGRLTWAASDVCHL